MKRYADDGAAEAFCASRLGMEPARQLGTLELDAAGLGALVERARLTA
jgi:hypothetical protein